MNVQTQRQFASTLYLNSREYKDVRRWGMPYCGVVLAGGKGTRMGELTRVTNKHLLPVGEFPMIYYPIKKLIGAGITNILVVSGTEHMGDFVNLLGSGKRLGCQLTYRVQDEAGGIAQALGLARQFCCGSDRVVVLLGDNVFYDPLEALLAKSDDATNCAFIALKEVNDPQRYGVAYFDEETDILSEIIEKPDRHTGTGMAVTGIYVFPNDVFDVINMLKPSGRGELEVTDLNQHYLDLHRMGHIEWKGYWTDAGEPLSYALANELVRAKPPIYTNK